MANVKITALNHISAAQLAPEDVFVLDDVSQLITYKVTLANVTRYMSTAVTEGVTANLDAFAAYANANAAVLANAISNISTEFTLSDGTNTALVGAQTLTFSGSNGIQTAVGTNELNISLSNTGIIAGSYGGIQGSTYYIPSIIVDSQGRISSAQNVSVAIDFTNVYSQIDTVSANVDGVETRRNDNTFYSYSTGIVSASANINPASNNIYSLGTPSAVWKDVYVGQGSVYLGAVRISSEDQQSLTVTTPSANYTLSSNTASAYTKVLELESNVIGSLGNLQTSEKSNLVSAINEAAVNRNFASVNIGNFTAEETVLSNVSSAGASVVLMDANTNKFAKLLVNVTDLTYGQYQSSEILLVHDNIEVKLVEYAIISTSTSPLVTFDASISGSNVILSAATSSADNIVRILKFIN